MKKYLQHGFVQFAMICLWVIVLLGVPQTVDGRPFTVGGLVVLLAFLGAAALFAVLGVREVRRGKIRP